MLFSDFIYIMDKDFDFSKIPGKIVIGLTGPIAGGKSFALSCFKKYGAEAISADEVNKDIWSDPAIFDIISERYKGTNAVNGSNIDKKELAEIIFNDSGEKKWLEGILHPIILERMFNIAKKSAKRLIAAEMPLLFEAGLKDKFTFTMCIETVKDKLYDRAFSRGWTAEHYEKRCAGQFSLEKKCEMADFIIRNNGSRKDFEEKIRKFCLIVLKTIPA